MGGMAEEQLQAHIKAFLDKNYPSCGVAGCSGEGEEAWAIIDLVKAAGFGPVKEAAAAALEEAADEPINEAHQTWLRARAAAVLGEG